MLIAAALWSKWHLPASTTTTTTRSTRRGAVAGSECGAAAPGAWRMAMATLDMHGYVPPSPAGGRGSCQFSLDLAMFVANVCGFEFKLK